VEQRPESFSTVGGSGGEKISSWLLLVGMGGKSRGNRTCAVGEKKDLIISPGRPEKEGKSTGNFGNQKGEPILAVML